MRVKRGEFELTCIKSVKNGLLDDHFAEIDRITRIKTTIKPRFSRQKVEKNGKKGRFQAVFYMAGMIMLSSNQAKKEPFTSFFDFFSHFFLTFSDYQCIVMIR